MITIKLSFEISSLQLQKKNKKYNNNMKSPLWGFHVLIESDSNRENTNHK